MLSKVKGWVLDVFQSRARSVGSIRYAASLIERSVGKSSVGDTVRQIQRQRLKHTLQHALEKSQHYRQSFGNDSFKDLDLASSRTLQSLPFTTSKEIRDWERFLCVPEDQLSCVYTTSGTTGEPKRIFFTRKDIDVLTNWSAVSLRYRHPGRMIVLIALPTSHGLWIGSASAQRIVERAGGLPLPVGAEDPIKTLKWMERFRPNIVISSPSYMSRLTRQAEECGYKQKLDRVLLSGEGLSHSQKVAFTEYWQAHVLDSYGTTEIGGGQTLALPDCTALHLNELHLVTEIVDFETGKPAEEGELVFTTLMREAMPLIRYRSGDRAKWAECKCGLPFRAIKVDGRLDDMMVAGDMNLYGNVLAQSIASVPGATGKIKFILDKVDLGDRMTLQVGGQNIDKTKVEEAFFQCYPEARTNVANGNLKLEVEPNAELGDQLKAVKVDDKRSAGNAQSQSKLAK